MDRFAPDFEDVDTLEVPDFRRRSQKLLHLLIGADISAEEYLEKLDLIQVTLKEVYQDGISMANIQHDSRSQELASLTSRVTARPPPPAPHTIELDWGEFDPEEFDPE